MVTSQRPYSSLGAKMDEMGLPTISPDLSLGIAELGRLLRAGKISPVDLAQTALDGLEKTGRTLNAVVTLTPERAMEQAKQAEREIRSGQLRGPLHGIPWGAKDLLATAGIPTTWGAAPLRDQRFDVDAAVVERLRDAGAVLVAKHAMVELAGGAGYDQPDAALTGPGRNAWDRETWSGGSSSGSGAAVAAGLVPFAIGSETWGSITTPSALNGITGLRPTYGRVSRRGAMALSWTMDKLGPMARSADDCWLVLQAIAGSDPGDPTSVDRPLGELRIEDVPFRLATPEGWTDALGGTIAENFRASLDVLQTIATIEEIQLPDLPWTDAASLIISAEGASALQDLIEDGTTRHLTAPEDRYGLYTGLALPAVDYLRALRVRRRGMWEMESTLARFDGIVAPTLLFEAPPIDASLNAYFGDRRGPSLGALGNLCGLPTITIPNGFGDRGLPTGIEILGAPWTEEIITSIAIAYQARTDWHRRRPPA
jgi:aspartyl-tRNA(Asn)/glutamyl-tRNA(Gln) amidotransferase subunit A